MTQQPPTTNSPLGSTVDPNTLVGYGIPTTGQGAQFMLEEQAASAARGQGNPFAGWKLPKEWAGDFWQLFSQAEQFAANTGWRNLLTPQQLIDALKAGMATADSSTVFGYFARITKVDQNKMPWAATGLNASQYSQVTNNLNDGLFALTGQANFGAAGLSSIAETAIAQNWSETHLKDYIQQNPALNAQYGWLQHGLDYQGFANFKIQNADILRSRFGHQFTDQNALQQLGDPLTQFHASGGAFGQQTPFISAESKIPTGTQSGVR